MKYHELIKHVKKYNFTFYKNAKGSHEIWKDKNGNIVIIPRHSGKEIPSGTCSSILKKIKQQNENNYN